MATHIQLAQVILNQDGFRDKEWKEVSLLSSGVHLGNFVKKRLSKYFFGLIPSLEKYYYELRDEELEEFLVKREGHTFNYRNQCSDTIDLAGGVYDEKIGIGAEIAVFFKGNIADERKITIPARKLKIILINRSNLEEDLRSWKLDMKSPFIRTMKDEKCIPCIVSKIVEVMKPEDETDCKAVLIDKQKREANVGPGVSDSMPVVQKGNISVERTTEQSACVSGPVLYKVLPLEVDEAGDITVKENSKGFTEDVVVPDGTAGNFSSRPSAPTLQTSFNKIEEWLRLIVEQDVAAAFKSVTYEDIHYLCRVFGQAEDSYNDVEIPDNMSKNCRDILLFAKFERQTSGSLTLKEKYTVNPPKSFVASYYLTVVLSDIQPTIHNLLKQSKDNMFPLLKDILLREKSSEGIPLKDDVWNTRDAMALLKMLDIDVRESKVVALPPSLEQLTSVIWAAMLYGGTAGALQQQ